MLTAFVICLIIDLGWLELTLMSVGVWLSLRNGRKVLLVKLKVMSRKLTILRFNDISILNPCNLKVLIIFLCILEVWGPLRFGIKMRP